MLKLSSVPPYSDWQSLWQVPKLIKCKSSDQHQEANKWERGKTKSRARTRKVHPTSVWLVLLNLLPEKLYRSIHGTMWWSRIITSRTGPARKPHCLANISFIWGKFLASFLGSKLIDSSADRTDYYKVSTVPLFTALITKYLDIPEFHINNFQTHIS